MSNAKQSTPAGYGQSFCSLTSSLLGELDLTQNSCRFDVSVVYLMQQCTHYTTYYLQSRKVTQRHQEDVIVAMDVVSTINTFDNYRLIVSLIDRRIVRKIKLKMLEL